MSPPRWYSYRIRPSDSPGLVRFPRIRSDSDGFGRILIFGKFGQIWSDSVGLGWIWSDSVGVAPGRGPYPSSSYHIPYIIQF